MMKLNFSFRKGAKKERKQDSKQNIEKSTGKEATTRIRKGMKIGTKISLGFLIMLVLMLVLGGNTYRALTSTKADIDAVDIANRRLLLEMKIQHTFKDGVAAVRGFIAFKDEKLFQQFEKDINHVLEMEDQLLQLAEQDKINDIKDLKMITTQYKTSVQNRLTPAVKAYYEALRSGDQAQIEAKYNDMYLAASGLNPMADLISRLLEELVQSNNEIVQSSLLSTKEEANRVITVSLVMAIAAVITGLLLTVTLTRMVRNPILQMVAGANQLARGDFTGDIVVKSKDEIGEMYQAFKTMKGNFKDVLLGIQDASGQLNAAAQQLAAQAQQTSAGAAETASTMNEIAGTVDNLSQITEEVSRQAGLASEHADKGYQGIEMVTGQMREITAAALQVNSAISALNAAIGKISQFIEVIGNIAGQTNLLALNAAIEAARAGEAGRGFAVVAEEVRKLAEQSAQSAKEISQLIAEIQVQSEQAVQAMANGSARVEEGNNIVGEVGQRFSDIINAVRELSVQIQDVAASARQVTAGVQNVAATTQQQTAAMEEVHAATEDLNRLAEGLNELVRKFKI
ncbi:methyl-accepting chemotaxis protein [Desulfallas sp. Bu1-1]|uniref:methyl-accepting chemotaxis protein n=1 Tax=Desulfallas sp. Bu1-1 TaxID=2787620 RepID=UPI001FADE9C0|nr:methyl-accepting chemotaxis protein [Desulfallas sp. Bu1-1]